MSYSNIERCLGLHQDVNIIYVVDGFQASLSNEDGYSPNPDVEPVYEAHGETIEDALFNLNAKLEGVKLENHTVSR